jgi:hypothetical protein
MNTQPILPRPFGTIIVASALSFLITIGLFFAVTGLFLLDGAPLHNIAMAERACSDLAFVSERDACVRSLLAAAHYQRVASR